MLLAGIFKSPGIMLTEKEAHDLADATLNVSRHYPQFQAAQKTIDWANFCTVAVIIYGTRIMAASAAKRAAKTQTGESAQVIYPGFPGGPGPKAAPAYAGDQLEQD